MLKTQIGYGWKHKLISENTNFKKGNSPFVHTSKFVFLKHIFVFQNTDSLLQKADTCFIPKHKFVFFKFVFCWVKFVFSKKILFVFCLICVLKIDQIQKGKFVFLQKANLPFDSFPAQVGHRNRVVCHKPKSQIFGKVDVVKITFFESWCG